MAKISVFVFSVLVMFALGAAPSFGQEQRSTTKLANVLSGRAPSNANELLAMQEHIRSISERLVQSTVAIQVGRANGSGVIISKTGYILTAAHVAGTPNEEAVIYLADGRRVFGKTLGMNEMLDAGLVKIDTPGEWPFAELGKSSNVEEGFWCLATGHPGGYDSQRKPVLRMGRVLKAEDSAILTDCTLVGGDSGGPLFDLNGRVIGVHSRIGKNLTVNVHVPVDSYREAWDRLVKGDAWDLMRQPSFSWIGVKGASPAEAGVQIGEVVVGSPAQDAGLQPGDQILSFAGNSISQFDQLKELVRDHKPGETVRLEVKRGGEFVRMSLRIGSTAERTTQKR
ncbi:MAG: trypsin-like peptidase domain-containing protein [Planctomycetales bacterium]|nr:trypsin-like peptidase domain-containing protein [Planctomycetales bacterium]